jgi:hypothetical protein
VSTRAAATAALHEGPSLAPATCLPYSLDALCWKLRAKSFALANKNPELRGCTWQPRSHLSFGEAEASGACNCWKPQEKDSLAAAAGREHGCDAPQSAVGVWSLSLGQPGQRGLLWALTPMAL